MQNPGLQQYQNFLKVTERNQYHFGFFSPLYLFFLSIFCNLEKRKMRHQVLKRNPHVNILSDDIYEHVTYDNFKFFTIAQIPEIKNKVVTMNGVSKSYAMTGWRIGYAAGDKEIIKAIAKIQSQSTTNPSSISQAAAVEALNGKQDFIPIRAKAFQERRDFVVNSLNA